MLEGSAPVMPVTSTRQTARSPAPVTPVTAYSFPNRPQVTVICANPPQALTVTSTRQTERAPTRPE